MSIHLIINGAEQQAIINALAFYNDYHAGLLKDQAYEAYEQWQYAFNEDNRSQGADGPVDKLATKVAAIN